MGGYVCRFAANDLPSTCPGAGRRLSPSAGCAPRESPQSQAGYRVRVPGTGTGGRTYRPRPPPLTRAPARPHRHSGQHGRTGIPVSVTTTGLHAGECDTNRNTSPTTGRPPSLNSHKQPEMWRYVGRSSARSRADDDLRACPCGRPLQVPLRAPRSKRAPLRARPLREIMCELPYKHVKRYFAVPVWVRFVLISFLLATTRVTDECGM